MRVSLEAGWVLHTRPYRETSLLVEALSREHGRVGLVARGARGAKSRLRGVLQPLQPLMLSWVGRGELCTLTGAEPMGAPPVISATCLSHTFYLQELLLRLLQRNDPHPGLFDAYGQALHRLSDPSLSVESTLRVFENALLHELGYGLVLDRDVGEGNPIEAEQSYTYCLEHGPVLGVAEKPGVPVSGAALQALASGQLRERKHLSEIKQLMRATLSLYLGERPLKSRELFYSFGVQAPENATEEGPDG